MEWIAQARKEILRDWKQNKISWATALARLHGSGLSTEDSAQLLART